MFDIKLFRITNKLTQTQVAEYLGVTQAYISQIERGLLELPDEYIDKIKNEGVYSVEFSNIPESNRNLLGSEIKVNYKLLPLVNMDVVGGINNQEVDTSQYIRDYIPFVNAKEGDICCPVTGRSMDPIYPGGCIVQIRKIIKWKEYLEFGQVYVIDLEDGRRLIKEVKKGKNEDFFLLRSCNKDYEDREIPIDMIYSVWLVIAKYEKSTM